MTLDPEVWVWLITTIIGLIAAIWAIAEAWSDYQIARIGSQSRRITPLAVDDTRADIFQEFLTLVIFVIAGVLVTSVIIPIRELIPYVVWGLNAILQCVIIKLLLRRLNRRLLWRKAGISRKRVK
jgi:hypothetical protein